MNKNFKLFDYNFLYKNYQKNLLKTLRSFGDGDELSLWVPDENINKSLINLFDSTDIQSIQINFDQNSFSLIDKNLIVKSLGATGSIKFLDDKFSIYFNRQDNFDKKNFSQINKIEYDRDIKLRRKNIKTIVNKKPTTVLLKKLYLENLKKIKIKKSFLNIFEKDSTLIKIRYKDESYSIELLINPSNHFIVDGTFTSKKKNIIIDLFSKYFLSSAINLPINEVKDHLLNKIEFDLRPNSAVKNQGVILKNNVGVIFVYFQRVIDKIYLDYLKKNPTKFGLNSYDYKIPEFWKNLDEKEKFYSINEYLELFKKSHFNTHDLYLVNISNHNKLFFNFEINLNGTIENAIFFKLENFLKKNLKVKFEVYYVNRKDENILRNL